MKDRIELETTYPHSPDLVWHALTDPEALGKWLMPCDLEPLIGFRFRFQRPDGSSIKGQVTDVELSRLLAYRWDEDDGQESLVVWRLEPIDGGTRVHLEHLPLAEPTVTRLPIDAHFNWLYALRHGLPGLLRLLQAQERLVGIRR